MAIKCSVVFWQEIEPHGHAKVYQEGISFEKI